MIDLILHFLLLGGVIFALAEMMPGLNVPGYGTAVVVAVVYGLINVTLGTVLMWLAIPFVVITLGLFMFVINAILLWLTDMLIDDFEIDTAGTTIVAAVIITIADVFLGWIF